MKSIKKAFAVVFAVMAVMLMSTAVFAEVISGNGFDFIQLGNVNADTNNVVDKADAALLLKYIDGTATLSKKQVVAARMTDSTKDDPDMLDVIAILNK